jgi:ABC-2 type transport system permease protein
MVLFAKTMRDARTQVLIYGLGIAAYIALNVFIYPSFDQSFEGSEDLEAFVGSLDYTNPRNYLNAQIGYFAPLILSIFAITFGTGALAGEEGRGTLETLLAQPWSRRRLFLQKALGIGVAAAVVCLLSCLGYLVSAPLVDLRDVDIPLLIISPLAWVPFLWACMALSLLAGVLAPARGQAVGIVAGVVVLSYLVTAIADISDSLSWLRYLSIYYYSDTQVLLSDGITLWHQAVLFGVTGVAITLALRVFERRELNAGTWQFSAARTA